ncbi:MAG TPA: phosphatidylcholine/phosphatidylserine synthase [Pyrinomonadaceae bacterium]|nr:phosphatidylcholine/phosphatidylserine synthase [Pyrinomonadaceae bacterium]
MSAPQSQAGKDTENPERRGIKKGLYLVPSLFTTANILMGFYTVMSALRAFQLIGQHDLTRATPYLDNGAKAIGWALLFDMLDGRIARLTKTTTEIGVQLDSIADVISFGLAPAVLAYVWSYGAALSEGSDLYNLALFISFMYLMCGAFRLARFNVQSSRPRILAEGTIKVDKKSYVGLPIPVAGGLLAALVHFRPAPLISYGFEKAELYSLLMIVLIGTLSILMVSTLRFSSFKTVGTKIRSMRTVILGLGLIMLIFLFSRYVLLAIVLAYILYGLLSRMWGLFRRRPELSGSNVRAKES